MPSTPLSSTERYCSSDTSNYKTITPLVITGELATQNVKSSVQTTLETLTSSPFSTEISGTTTDNNNKCEHSTEFPDGIDFSPCSCHWFSPETYAEAYVTCDLANMTEVRDELFSRLDHIFIGFLELIIMDGDFIPSRFMGSAVRRINYLFIDCTYMNSLLNIHEEAFKNSDDNMTEFNFVEFRNCNVFSLNFFSWMKHVDNLLFSNSSNLHDVLSTIPDDFGIYVLRITKCRNLDLIDSDSKLPGQLNEGLIELRIYENEQVGDTAVDVMLEWLLSTTSKDSLSKFYINNNDLTRIPTQLWRLNQLRYFRFDNNKLITGIVEKGNFKFSYLTWFVSAYNCGIHTILPDAFQGML